MNKSKYFYCYSNRLFKFLEICGIRYITYGVNPKNNMEYHMYERTDNLNWALDEWEKIKIKFDLNKVISKMN